MTQAGYADCSQDTPLGEATRDGETRTPRSVICSDRFDRRPDWLAAWNSADVNRLQGSVPRGRIIIYRTWASEFFHSCLLPLPRDRQLHRRDRPSLHGSRDLSTFTRYPPE